VVRAIADYELLRELGAGGQGRYFLANRPPRLRIDAEQVAVKVFARESTSDTFRQVAERLRAYAAVRSPYLGQLYDVGLQDGIVYTAMEYLPQGSLIGATARVAPPLRVRAVGDAARALSALHLADLVHGAVKPGNVLLDPYGAKLADPDLSYLMSPGRRATGTGPTGLEFADPALLLGEPPAPEHDVWSIGSLLHWVIGGATPYPGIPLREGVAALRRVVAGHPVIDPELPEAVAAIVRDCLAPVDERPGAAAVADRIAAVAAELASPR
jgi:serine/threonine protein kinase